MRLVIIVSAFLCAQALAAVDFLELADVRGGQKGVGKTVLQGDELSEFTVEILGVLDNVWPQQSLIIARLEGANLDKTGVIAGMSGSPVYIEDKLLGAVAFAFPFATEPLAGIRPIADMVNAPAEASRQAVAASTYEEFLADPQRLSPIQPVLSGSGQFVPISTPLSFGGFTTRTIEVFGEQLTSLGIRPVQGVGGQSREGAARSLEPGSMISVGLIRGDLSATAAGTVTHVDGGEIYAFGHRFLSSGPVDLDMMASSVVTVVPNLQSSFKMAGVGPELGAITLDRSAGIVGSLGQSPKLIPTKVKLNETDYNFELVRDSFLTPFLLQLALFSVVDSTERSLGPSNINVTGSVSFSEDVPKLVLDDVYSSPGNAPFDISQGTSSPLAFGLQHAVNKLTVQSIDIEMNAVPRIEKTKVIQGWTDKTSVRPGEDVKISTLLRDQDGKESLHEVSYNVPAGLKEGELRITVADASQLNFQEILALFESSKLPARELVETLNRLRASNGLYLQAWRAKRGFRVAGQRLQSPPASLKTVLAAPQASGSGAAQDTFALLDESKIGEFPGPVEGSITLQVNVKE